MMSRAIVRRCVVVLCAVTTALVSVVRAVEEVLIIPDIGSGSVGMYDAEDGAHLGDLVPPDAHLGEVHCAAQGPDGLIYVSDQIQNKIFRFNPDGTFFDTFVDVSLNDMNFPKGMDFVIEDDGSFSVLVAALFDFQQGEKFFGRIAKYSEDGVYDPEFLDEQLFPGGIFDIFVDTDDSIWYVQSGTVAANLADGGAGRIDPSGQDLGLVMSARGANQVVRSPVTGNLMVSVLAGYFFGEPHFHEFDADGMILASWNIPGPIPAPHGVERLGSGEFLCVGDSGVWRVDPNNGFSATLVRSGSGHRMVHRASMHAECAADLDGSTDVGVDDLLALLSTWGDCSSPCPADLDDNGNVGVNDLLQLLAAWGPC